MKLIVDWFPTVSLTALTAAFFRLQWYYYDRTKLKKTEWNFFKIISFYMKQTKIEYGHIGVSFWVLLMTPFFAFTSLVLQIFYYKHM
jgi:hypothetical protein